MEALFETIKSTLSSLPDGNWFKPREGWIAHGSSAEIQNKTAKKRLMICKQDNDVIV